MKSGFTNPLARQTPAIVGAARAIKQWSRDAFRLGDADAVFVNELACSVPGCPPKETVIVIMSAGRSTRQISVHKAMVDVTEQDIAEACTPWLSRSAV
ncbi:MULTISPECIES: hypothetical protein [unclassified Rhizobium]|uniref:hypothetical protein n=1 Tax=unclassified Rhizobium TaxID=2613769 RepID=UPI00104AAFC3|nr:MULTISPECIES: hypothetical protein [unclassified Rhizobium]MBB3399344.1 hypothetical protein [Rhizobium sp. BK060]MBB4166625.1 hypothetical protein [Rhizobium sp. BK538]TCM67627.1 hypothetical protein EV291_13334 [Rhizobium sp. BK068]